METWMVCAQGAEGERLARELGRVRPHAKVRVERDPRRLRTDLAASRGAGWSVLVGDKVDGIEGVNLAAALVGDGGARQVILVAPHPSGSLISRAGRAGVSQVVDASCGLAVLGEAPVAQPRRMDELLPAPSSQSDVPPRQGAPMARAGLDGPNAPVICFASGRGGVGKTTLVAVCSLLASSWGMEVACLDLDLAFGNLFSTFGMDGPADLSELALYASGRAGGLERGEVVAAGRQADEGVGLWGSCDLPEHAELVEPIVGELVRHLAAGNDLVLIDTSPAWSDGTALAAQVADRLALVSDGAGGVGSLSRAAALAVRLGVTRSRIVQVANRCERRREEEDYLLRANVGLETARLHRLAPSADATELLGLGRASDLAFGGSEFSASAAAFLAKTLEELGALPDDPGARQAIAWRERKGRSWLFGKEAR